jgi:hypothetical protein
MMNASVLATKSNLKMVLIPRQALLKKSDPSGNLPVPEVRAMLEPYVRDYQHPIIQDRVTTSMDIKRELQIYKSFHKLGASRREVMFLSGARVQNASPIMFADAHFSLCLYSFRICASLQSILQLPSLPKSNSSPSRVRLAAFLSPQQEIGPSEPLTC